MGRKEDEQGENKRKRKEEKRGERTDVGLLPVMFARSIHSSTRAFDSLREYMATSEGRGTRRGGGRRRRRRKGKRGR